MDDFQFNANKFYKLYLENKDKILRISHQEVGTDGKVQIYRVYENQKRETIFLSGVKREAYPDGYVIVHFTNNDIKQILPDKTEIYFYAEANTT